MTKIYVLDRGENVLPEACIELLPPWRRERTEKLRNENARQESLAVGILWMKAMEEWGVESLASVAVLPAGKPVLSSGEGPFFSLSHSGRYVLCVVSDNAVGGDVQQMRKVNLSISRRLHPLEQQWLAERDEETKTEEFFRLWARKEAWVKAESGERMLSLSEADVIHDLPGWHFWDYALPGGYRAAVCAREKGVPQFILFTGNELLRK